MTQSIVISTTVFDAVVDAVSELIQAVEADGLIPGEVLPDGVLRRCGTTDKPKSKNGWYVLHADPFAGAYGNWATGLYKPWSLHGEPLPPAIRQRLKQDIERQKAERLKAEGETKATATAEARGYLDGLKPATDSNQYLKQKGVKAAAGLLADGDVLVVPVLGEDDKPISYQRIDPTGSKRFCPGAPVAGGWFAINWNGGSLLICEGVATGLSLHEATGFTVLCAFSAGNLEKVAKMARSQYPERQIILAADNDTKNEAKSGKNLGVEVAKAAAVAVNGLLAIPEAGGDWNDIHAAQGLEAVKSGIESARPVEEIETAAETDTCWPEPLPLPDGMPPVADFVFDLLPSTLRPWATDITDRMQCPADYTSAAIMAALGSIIGRRVGIRPQESTDWTVTPNLWALLIGRPGVLKSPAMEAALAPIKILAARAAEAYKTEVGDYERAKIADKLRAEASEKSARAALQKNPGADISGLLEVDKSEPPTMNRYMANDTTAAALGELHRQNQNGLLVFRDELVSLLRSLDQEENSEARGFYLTGWNGDSPFTFDRISRGLHLHIPAVCISLLGSTQPARIAQYVRGAVSGNSDDGLLQRFGLTVWPDISGGWKDVDRWPDSEARQKAFRVFERLARLDPFAIGGKQDTGSEGDPDGIPYLRFDPAGLGLFREWRKGLESRLRSGNLHPVLESHLSKYRKLVPGLALICHLAEGTTGPVGRSATLMALAWSEYLETHARRLYASVAAPTAATARAIIAKIRSGALPAVFKVRDIYKPQWTGLTDLETIKAGIKLLVERDWMIETRKNTGGRPSFEYNLNPKTDGMR